MLNRNIPWLAGIAVALGATLLALAGDSSGVSAQLVGAASCRSACLAQYNQCRMSTKGSPTCDAHYQSCLQACIAPKH